MALEFGSPKWADALAAAINASSEYRNAGKSWGVGFNGNILLGFEPGQGLTRPLHLFLRLGGGRCEGAEFVPGPTHPEAGYALRAPYPLWREILAGKTLAATAILMGRMKVEGNSVTLLRHAGAHRSLLHCVATLDTRYP